MVSYPGGKNGAGVYQTIINHIPPHETYIEPFVGGGAVLRHIRPAASSIAIDSDASVIKNLSLRTKAELICGDGLKFLAHRKWTGREFVYCDPPYLMKTRKSQRPIYRQEWDTADHMWFLELVLRLPCNIAISGYASDLYNEALAGWNTITFTAQTRRGPVTETLWFNYPVPTALHDCRYLGADFRQRERIKRKADRWATKYAAMPDLEAQAVLSAMIERARSHTAICDDAGFEHRQIERACSQENNISGTTPLEAAILAEGVPQ